MRSPLLFGFDLDVDGLCGLQPKCGSRLCCYAIDHRT